MVREQDSNPHQAPSKDELATEIKVGVGRGRVKMLYTC